MEITFKGANCLVLNTKRAQVVLDDNLAALGGKSASAKADIVLYSAEMLKPKDLDKEKMLIDCPGEYEISGVSVYGIAARAHMDANETDHSATIYKISSGGLTIVNLGHIHPDLSDEQLEQIGMVDILFVPVGGNGYTLDAVGAAKLVKKIEPKAVVATHYKDDSLSFEVPQNEQADFYKDLGLEPQQMDKIKSKGLILPESMAAYELTTS